MKNKKIEENSKKKKRVTIRCRKCLIIDSYDENEKCCRHCGSILFKKVDEVQNRIEREVKQLNE